MADTTANLQVLLDHAGWLQGLARRLVGDAAADDVLQEVWLKALDHPPRQIDSPPGWLRATLRSVQIRRLQRGSAARYREREVARQEALPSAAELTERAEAQKRLVEAVLALKETQRRLVLLHFFEGVSAAEIARRSGEPASTIRTCLARALDHLREHLLHSGNEGCAWLPALPLLAWPRTPVLPASALAPTGLLPASFVMGKLIPSLLGLVTVAGAYLWFLDPPQAWLVQQVEDASSPRELASLERESSAPELAVLSDGSDRTAPSAPADPEEGLPPSKVRGQVVDPGGHPVGAATVYEGTLAQVAMSLRNTNNPARPQIVTDLEGRFTFDLGDPRSVVLSAWASGFAASEELVVDLTAAPPTEIVLTMRQGATVSGFVFGIDQQPIGDREVQVSSQDLGEFRTVSSDANGYYELSALNPGPWRAATYPSQEEMTQAGKPSDPASVFQYLAQAEFILADGEELDVNLGQVDAESPRVTGRLLRDGKPIGGLMQWYPADRPMEKKMAKANAQGHFEIDLPKAGPWTVHANAMGSASRGQRRTLELKAGAEEELVFDLTGARLAGRVVDPFGVGVEGVRVELRTVGGAPHQPDPTLGGDSQRTDDTGAYAFELLESGTYRVVAHGAPPNADSNWGAAVSPPIEVKQLVSATAPDISLEAGYRFEVRVQDGTGRALSGASLFFHSLDGSAMNPCTETRTNSEGLATSPAFSTPVWVTAVHRTGASPARLAGGDDPRDLVLTVASEHWLELDVGSTWVDVATDHVAVLDGEKRRWGGLVDIRRLFEARPERDFPRRPLFGPLPAGHYRVKVERSSGEVLEGELTLDAATSGVSTVRLR